MRDNRLNFEQFQNIVKESIRDHLPEEYRHAEIKISEYQKLNASYTGMQVRKDDQSIFPNINLTEMFDYYQKTGMSMEAVLTSIAQQVQLKPDLETDFIKDYSMAKDHLFIRVSNAKDNEDFLKKMPHREVDGLAITYHINLGGTDDMAASVPVTDQLLAIYGISEEQLHADAMESTQKVFPAQFVSMEVMMRRMMGVPEDMEMPPMGVPGLMVLTNDQTLNGAGALFYPGQMDQVAQQMEGDFFVLPSSIHEVLILADDGTMDLDSLQFMVREVNRSTVDEKEQLSDFVYHYDAKDHVLEKAETFAERMFEKEHQAKEETSRSTFEKDGDGRKERSSVLQKLNDKKEQLKVQPKKETPGRRQEVVL